MRYNTFDDTAFDYDKWVTPCRVHQVKALADELNLGGKEKVLEIGVGSGLLTGEILRRLDSASQFTGIDLSPKMISLCRVKMAMQGFHDLDLHIGNSLKLEFADNSFDVIVSSNVLPWVGDQDRFIGEVKRMLRPEGKFGLIALHREVYREFFAALDDVRAVHPHCFNGRSVLDDIGVRLEDIRDHCRRLQTLGFCIDRSYVFSTTEPTTPDEYVRRFNAVTGETHFNSVPLDKREFIRQELLDRLSRVQQELTITEAINILIARRDGIPHAQAS